MTTRKQHIKHHFESESRQFDRIILRNVPGYHDMVAALVGAIPFNPVLKIKVLDLGCGTGAIAWQVKQRFPKAQLTCQDQAEGMLAMAQKKLAAYPDVNYLGGDFSKIDFGDKYDAIVSSLALHHLGTAKAKKEFYGKLYHALKPQGVFINADIMISPDAVIENFYLSKWREFLRTSNTPTQIAQLYKKYRREDRPAALAKHLEWLQQAGFKKVDVIWKAFKFCVYFGRR
jgi:tRNA (cmo5U34)-methyltransferase